MPHFQEILLEDYEYEIKSRHGNETIKLEQLNALNDLLERIIESKSDINSLDPAVMQHPAEKTIQRHRFSQIMDHLH